jgi:hypothetical protein
VKGKQQLSQVLVTSAYDGQLAAASIVTAGDVGLAVAAADNS